MFRDEKNLKDSSKDTIKDTSSVPTSYQTASPALVSYAKTQKLITALYMVTDIMDNSEPLRNKLRTLGVEILSDMHLIQQNNIGHAMSFINGKITEVMSFLNIASDLNIISEMNCNILRKEFTELDQSIKASVDNAEALNRRINLAEFFTEETFFSPEANPARLSNRIGVQKGSTLLKALEKIKVSDKNVPAPYQAEGFGSGFETLKKQRRQDIINVIKTISGGATIKDIKDKVQANPNQAGALVSCGEKTLQRELVSMVQNGVLYKTGDKRWSRYFIKNS
jgi:hypothetical protein